MEKIIRNTWQRADGSLFERAPILKHDVHPEGFDVERVRFPGGGRFDAGANAQLISVLAGRGRLELAGESLALEAGVHLYLPPDTGAAITAESGLELVQVAARSPSQARGTQVLLRDEAFLCACSTESQALRWVLTPQYLSRRIFLHHDPALLSRAGNPVSWFRTSMFDVSGLPPNQDGESVFKMSYNSRTEFNVIYEVAGEARVRFARHPYGERQEWDAWSRLDGDTTYHLNEAATDPTTKLSRTLRNKHEVHAAPGSHVTLFCLFDPAPTGVERHRPGEYSDYEPMADVVASEAYAVHQREIARYDRMLDRLSWAKARGRLDEDSEEWALYLAGKKAQLRLEDQLAGALKAEGKGRDRVLSRWMTT
jgi:hypothetical protein